MQDRSGRTGGWASEQASRPGGPGGTLPEPACHSSRPAPGKQGAGAHWLGAVALSGRGNPRAAVSTRPLTPP